MITRYGMSEKFGLMGLESKENLYLDGRTYLTCGDATATEIDHEIMKMLAAAYDRAKTMLSENRNCLDKISEYLIEKETITGKEFMDIFHEIKNGIEMQEAATEQETIEEKKKEQTEEQTCPS